MILYENTLFQFKKDILRKKLVNFLCSEYESASKSTVSGEIRYAWRYTFQIIYSMLNLMGPDANPESGVRIDLEEGGHARHLKLIFASSSNDVYHYSLLGLFAGSSVRLSRAEDIVVFREGSLQWSAIHPSMFMSSFARRLLRGSAEDGEASVSFECASWLFDCFFSCDSDIITDYKRQLTDEFPVFYANDTDELVQYLLPVLRQAGGLQALRKLSAIQALSAAKKTVDRNEDQIYLISSITNNVLRRRKAWYIIEGQTGTGKGEIIKGVTDKLTENGKTVFYQKGDEKPDKRPDLLVIAQKEGGRLEHLDYADVSIFLCDNLRNPNYENFVQDAALAARAREKDTQLYISHLKQAVSFADGGKGVRWLINVLQLADIQREDYDPDMYTINVVSSEEDLVKGDQGLATVVLPPNTVFNTKTEKITMRKTQKKGIYNALSSGRNGVQILCTDKDLKAHLEKQIAAVKNRQAWMRTYVGKLSDTKNTSEESMVLLPEDHVDKIREADSGYSKKIRSVLGKGAWNKLSEESRIWLVSAMMVYDYMKDVDRTMDFSGVCVQVGKACEYELKRRIFTAFVEYETSLYGEQEVLRKLPSECLSRGDGKNPDSRKILTEDKVTLGKLRYVMGLDDTGRIMNTSVWNEFRSYAEKMLLVHPNNSLGILRSQMPIIQKIRDDYRNRSAHSEAVSIVDARDCIEYVITLSRKLGVLLDQYRF